MSLAIVYRNWKCRKVSNGAFDIAQEKHKNEKRDRHKVKFLRG